MAQRHASPGHVVDVGPLGVQLRTAKTTALVKEKHFEAIRLVVHEGAEIPPHAVAGNITLYCLEGQVILSVPSGDIVLQAGQWVYLERGEEHSVRGIVDSSLLLTILFLAGGPPLLARLPLSASASRLSFPDAFRENGKPLD